MKFSSKRLLAFVLAFVLVLSLFPVIEPMHVHAATALTTSVDGLSASWEFNSKNTNGSVTSSGNTVTVTATGGILNKTKINLTLTNNLGSEATLKFSYSKSGGTISNAISGTSGTYEKVLANGASVTVTFESGRSQTNTLNITNISLISTSAADPNLVFMPGANGSYTVNGSAVTAETKMTVSAGSEVALVATPASGYQFYGWKNEKGAFVSQNATYTLTAAADTTITPVFISSSVALFGVGAMKYDNLSDAAAAAVAGTNKVIILLNNGTVSGNHTIPAGVTLLIPYDDANTRYGANAESTSYSSLINADGNVAWVKPSAYRTLTLASDASITVNGNIEVGGRHAAAGGKTGMYGGSPTDKLGYVNMLSGSHIELNSGANLYCWGYIYGEGTITAKNGASIYENFQIMDFRGGSVTSQLASEFLVFPLSQYYVQNIEVATRYDYGSAEYIATSIFMSNMCHSATVKFIGEGAMFQPAPGSYFVKDYNPATDMLEMHAYGDSVMSSMNLELGGTAIDSSAFVLPITNNISINLHSGTTTLKQNMMFLPGSSLIIGKDATLNLAYTEATGDVVTAGGYVLQVFDSENWFAALNMDTLETVSGMNFIHPSLQFRPVAYTCTSRKTRTTADLKDVTIDINGRIIADGFIYSTVTWADAANEDYSIVSGGANIISSEKTGMVVMNNGAGMDMLGYMYDQSKGSYYFIPLASMQLKNGDGTLLDTTGAEPGTAFGYCAACDCWYANEHTCGPTAFEITWIIDGNESTQEFAIGTNPVYNNGVNPVRPAVNCTTYTFSGWKDASGNFYAVGVTLPAGENTFTAQFVSGTSHVGDTDNDHKCNGCGETLSSCFDGDDANHDCDVCDAPNVDDGCYGGNANCVTKAVCAECGQSYGNFDSSVHANNEVYYDVVDNEFHNVMHSCCKTVSKANEEHSFGTNAICVCKAKAVVEFTVIGTQGPVTLTLTPGANGIYTYAGRIEKGQYQFKLQAGNALYGYDGLVEDNTADSYITLGSQLNGDLKITGGTYTITYDFATQGLKIDSVLDHFHNYVTTFTWGEHHATCKVTFTCTCNAIFGDDTTVSATIEGNTIVFTATSGEASETLVLPYTASNAVFFDNSKNNWDAVYAYVTNSSTGEVYAALPGSAMSYLGDNLWVLIVPEGYDTIAFGNGAGTQTSNLTIPSDGRNIAVGNGRTGVNWGYYHCPHSWVNPDCENDGYCAICGIAGEGSLGHSYDYDCSKSCNVCGEETRPEAECVSDASYDCVDGSCIYCGTDMPATADHDWVAPDCENDGYCANCNAAGEGATGHGVNGYTYETNYENAHDIFCVDCGNSLGIQGCSFENHYCVECKEVERMTVTFMNGDEYWNQIMVPYNSTLAIAGMPIPEIPTGQRLVGWYTADGVHVVHGMTVTEDMVAYVRWEEDKYTLTVVLPTGQEVELRVAPGSKMMNALDKAIEYDLLPAEGTFIRDTDQYMNGEYYINGSYVFDDYSNYIDESSLMPNADCTIVMLAYTYGWFRVDTDNDFITDSWQYTDYDKGLLGEGWHYIEEDYDDVTGGAWYYFEHKGLTNVRVEGITRVPYPTEPINGITYGPNAEDLAYAQANDIDFIEEHSSLFVFDELGRFQQFTGAIRNEDNSVVHYAVNGQLPWHIGLTSVGSHVYYFVGGNMKAVGDTYVTRYYNVSGAVMGGIYTFGADGNLCRYDGITEVDGVLRYYEQYRLMVGNGLTKVGDNYIYVRSNGELVVNANYYIPANDLGIVPGEYAFDENGYMINPKSTDKDGIYFENGAWYYYENGAISLNAGITLFDGYWYNENGEIVNEGSSWIYVRSNGKLATGDYYVTNVNNGESPVKPGDKCTFDEFGILLENKNGIVGGYYYENNKIVYSAGLIQIDGDYYYVRSNGQVVMGREYWISNANDTGIKLGCYTFDENGVMQIPETYGFTGIKDGFYYVDGAVAYGAGVVMLDDGTYIYVRSNGQLAVGKYWPTTLNGYLPVGEYDFGEDGILTVE